MSSRCEKRQESAKGVQLPSSFMKFENSIFKLAGVHLTCASHCDTQAFGEQLHDTCRSLSLAILQPPALERLLTVPTTHTCALCMTGSQVSTAAFVQHCAMPTCASKLASECMANLVGEDTEVLRGCQGD